MPGLGNAFLLEADHDYDHAPLLRTVVTPDEGHGAVVSAALVATGLGIFEGYVDGHPVGPDVLSPGWSSYEWRIREYAYDVTELVPDRPFVVGFSLGKGWAGGRLGSRNGAAFWTTKPALIAQLEISYADGHRQVVVTDQTWQSGPSQTTTNDLYDGQTIDARI
jgi:alpha-L-rhamnosidase